MLTQDEISNCIERAVMTLTQIVGVEDTKSVLDLLSANEGLSKLIHAVALEVSMASVFKGMELHEKEQSIITLKDGFPVLVYDKGRKLLAITIPMKGKYYMAGTDIELDIKPDCWYDIELFKKEDNMNG